MGAQRFIDRLAEQDVLPDKVLDRLRDKVEGSSTAPSSKALAQFLVDKGHLSREQADAALKASAPPRRSREERKKKAPSESKIRLIRQRAEQSGIIKAKSSEAKRKKRKQSEEEVLSATLLDDLGDDALAGGDLAGGDFGAGDLGGGELGGGGLDEGGKAARREKRKKKKDKKGENDFDTPLMLLGGGGLVLLVLAVGGIVYLLFSESAEERLAAANAAYEQGKYGQAVLEYEIFTEKFASHEKISDARVTLGIARIRKTPESNVELRLTQAKQEISQIEDEEQFPSVQEDLASLLPQIASGLAEKANAATELPEIKKYVALTREAMTYVANTKYVPSRLRDKQKLALIEEVLARIALRQVALEELEATLATMKKSAGSGDTRAAYAAHAAFVKAHPEKMNDPELLAAVAATSKAEQAGVKYVEERIAALASEAKSGVSKSVALADRRRTAEAPAQGVSVIQFKGSAYAFSRRDGTLLWRRPLGGSLEESEPLLAGDDCFLLNVTRQEVVRVAAATGKLAWRTPLEDDLSQPLLAGNRLLVAGKSGRLHVLDSESGDRVGYVQFAQPLQSAPAVFEAGKRIYLVGEHSSVYTLDSSSFECVGVFYLGHAKGAVVAQPQIVLNRLVVVENDGAATSRLHLLGLDEQGAIDRRLDSSDQANSRLEGLVTRPPEVFGRRFAVMTDRGQIGVFEASSEEGQTPLTLLATRPAGRQARSTRYSAVANKQLWVAGAGLARYSVQPSGKRLPTADVKQPFRGDTFVHPLRVTDSIVIHVRRRRGRAGATVAASDLNTGALYWETDIAAPAAGPPVTLGESTATHYATASGQVFSVDAAALERGVSEQVVALQSPAPAAEHRALLDAGASADSAIYASLATGKVVLLSGSRADFSALPLQLPGALAGPPTPFAEGWLAPLSVGQLYYFDPQTGAPLAAAFQPLLAPRRDVHWQEPGVTQVEGKPAVLVTNGSQHLYLVQLLDSPSPHLFELAAHELAAGEFASRVAVAGEYAAVAVRTPPTQMSKAEVANAEAAPAGDASEAESPAVAEPAEGAAEVATNDAPQPSTESNTQPSSPVQQATGGNQLMVFQSASLEPTATLALGAPVAWGPFGVGDYIVLATADNQLIGIAVASPDSIAWTSEIAAAELVGSAAAVGNRLTLALQQGVVQQRDVTTGEVVGRTDLGQAISGALAEVAGGLATTADDGTLLILDQPPRVSQLGRR